MATDRGTIFGDLYETYGRTVKLVRYVGRGSADDAQQAEADAIDIEATYHPFEVIGGPAQTPAFAEELVARKIMCLASCAGGPTEADLAEQVPHRWPLGPSTEQFARLTAELVGKSLAGKPAEYAGDALKKTKRTFGAIYFQLPGEPATAFDTFKDELGTYDVTLAAEVPYELDFARIQEIARTAVSKLKAAKVTTVILATDPYAVLNFTKEATAQDWYPEWVIGPNVSVDLNLAGRQYDQAQWVHAFGLKVGGVPFTDAAGKPIDVYDWYFGKEPPINQGKIPATLGVFDAKTSVAILDDIPADAGPPMYPSPGPGS